MRDCQSVPGDSPKPAFLITIDTEGDNLWAQPREITTRNSLFLPRFQSLCERHGFKPTYLTNYEMARCPDFQGFARDALRRGAAEVGMHLHAWYSPPHAPLTGDDMRHQPFLIEYPEAVLREKVAAMTGLLEETFGVKMLSHRAGRWSWDSVYCRALIDHGYRSDCSVTPLVSWSETRPGGTDYRRFPSSPYRVDAGDISRPGASKMLEIPMTIVSLQAAAVGRIAKLLPSRSIPARALGKFYPSVCWFRPAGGKLPLLRRVMRKVVAERRPHIEFMLHSSEFMPGGSPTFPSERSIDELYADLEALFEEAARSFRGMTLSGFEAGCGV